VTSVLALDATGIDIAADPVPLAPPVHEISEISSSGGSVFGCASSPLNGRQLVPILSHRGSSGVYFGSILA